MKTTAPDEEPEQEPDPYAGLGTAAISAQFIADGAIVSQHLATASIAAKAVGALRRSTAAPADYIAKLTADAYWTGPFATYEEAQTWINSQPTYRVGYSIHRLEKP